MGDPAVQTAAVAIRMGCWPFREALEDMDDPYDYMLAVACVSAAQRQDVDLRKSLAEFQAGKTIEFLGKAFKRKG